MGSAPKRVVDFHSDWDEPKTVQLSMLYTFGQFFLSLYLTGIIFNTF